MREVDPQPGVMAGREVRRWIEGEDAEASWVYDMAPVHVAPTRNAVARVQIYRLTRTSSSTPQLAGQVGRPTDELLVIGRFLVAPRAHAHGIARHLLKEARTHFQRQGKDPVLDLRANAYLTRELCERYGFATVPAADVAATSMIFVG